MSFNPRTPCGVRQHNRKKGTRTMKFQSTHSLRSATAWLQWDNSQAPVSIHALLAECDATLRNNKSTIESFNPRTPCGVRHVKHGRNRAGVGFQSTHSLRSATYKQRGGRPRPSSFNPRTPCGVRRNKTMSNQKINLFQSTHSLRSATFLMIT